MRKQCVRLVRKRTDVLSSDKNFLKSGHTTNDELMMSRGIETCAFAVLCLVYMRLELLQRMTVRWMLTCMSLDVHDITMGGLNLKYSIDTSLVAGQADPPLSAEMSPTITLRRRQKPL